MTATLQPSHDLPFPPPLPCGCVPGFVRCPVAAALWARVTEAWPRYHGGGMAREEYYAIAGEYLAHQRNGKE